MTARPAFELADVFRRHGETYERANAGHLGRVERRVIGAITACRTAALGGHVERCDDCGLTRIAYNSCRNRHCGKCQGGARAEWLAARQAELLPVPYFHVVFTLPPAAAEIAFQNKQTVYGLLMRAAAQALMTLAAERLGARIGLIAVLHTWGQTLTHHPHVHCLVPGGGVALDGQRWVACKPNFLLSVRALSKTFRRLFLDGLEAAFRCGELGFFGDLVPLAEAAAFAERVRALRQSGSSSTPSRRSAAPSECLPISPAIRIARRSPIRGSSPSTKMKWRSPTRIIAAAGGSRVMRLAPHEFIRRFLLHVLPDGFHRIRHYGFLAKGDRGESLARVRGLLQAAADRRGRRRPASPRQTQHAREPFARCPDCGGLMRRIGLVAPVDGRRVPLRHIMTSSFAPTSIARPRPHRGTARRRRRCGFIAVRRSASIDIDALRRSPTRPNPPPPRRPNRSTVSLPPNAQGNRRGVKPESRSPRFPHSG